MRPQELLGQRRELEAELFLEPARAQEAQRIVLEDRLGDCTQQPQLEILAAAARVDSLAACHRQRNRVDGEVAAREVGFDRPVHRREVDRPATVEHDAPRRVLLGERERESSRTLRVRARSRCRIAADDVHVLDAPAEQLVAHRAADEPRLLTGEHLAHEFIHRTPSGARAADLRRCRTRARS